MPAWIRRMTSRHLMYAWLGYWAGLAATTLWHPIQVAWRVSRPDAKGSIAAGFNNSTLTLEMVQGQATVLSRSIDSTVLLFWVCVPPLVMWFVWVLLRPRRGADSVVDRATPAPALGAAPPPIDSFSPPRERTPVPITPLP